MRQIRAVYTATGEHGPCGDVVRAGVLYFRAEGKFHSVPFWTECRCGDRRIGLSPSRATALRRVAAILGVSAPEAALVNSDGGSYYPFE